MKIIILFLIVMGLVSACSSKQMYHHAQHQEEFKCKKEAINISQMNDCLLREENKKSYDEYQEQLEEAKDENEY